MASFARLATETGSTKRVGAVVNGLVPNPTTNIASLSCIPLMPVDPKLSQEYEFTFREVLQTFVDAGLDIVEGDILVIDAVEYPIRVVADWPWKATIRRRLIVEQIK